MAEPVLPRPSATVMIVRDGANGLEIFMVARDRQVDFASGAVVFPGGKVDPDDHAEVWSAAPMPVKGPDRSYWIAAVRETFEESGLLIAERANGGEHLSAADVAEIGAQHRSAVLDGALTFSALAQTLGIVPAYRSMVHFAHWITPETMPKRFDTHFFLVAAKADHVATHDGREAVKSFWITPQELIAESEAGRQVLVPATKANLEMLAESTTVSDALATAGTRDVLPVMPKLEKVPGGMRLTIRTDAGYRTTEMLLKRPS